MMAVCVAFVYFFSTDLKCFSLYFALVSNFDMFTTGRDKTFSIGQFVSTFSKVTFFSQY